MYLVKMEHCNELFYIKFHCKKNLDSEKTVGMSEV